MKKSLGATFILSIALNTVIHCQPASNWSDPVRLTDTVTFNSNPNLLIDSPLLFYEKKSDSLSHSSIYYQDIFDNIEIPVLSNDTVSYRNPIPIRFDYDNYYLLYESDQNGNFDIYALHFNWQNVFGDTVQLTNTPEDESELNILFAPYYWSSEYPAFWLKNAAIYTGTIFYFNNQLLLDNIEIADTSCYTYPVVGAGGIFWQKFENNEYHIYKTYFDGTSYTTQPFYTTGNNLNLTTTRCLWDEYWNNYLVWENDGKILFYDADAEIDTIELPTADSAFQPSSFYYYVFTDDNYNATLSFTAGEDENQEIYVQDNSFGQSMVNVSNNNVKDSHSKLFQGLSGGSSWNFHCIWESEINNHSALYGSITSIIFGDVAENKTNKTIDIYPIPTHETINIHFDQAIDIASHVSISVLNMLGNKVDEIGIEDRPFGLIQITWNKGNLPAGIYYLVVRTKNETLTEKFIIL